MHFFSAWKMRSFWCIIFVISVLKSAVRTAPNTALLEADDYRFSSPLREKFIRGGEKHAED